ncbi:glutathione peroxidase [Acidisphaera sp. L21]|uniref:glutathione peroxidase n=1 Tax=Acidisphaera sp. L21 TaxID=1641851 RepID=UPI00131B5543|nr:glutathione peroxidase [Acidisphaera sp. L21]
MTSLYDLTVRTSDGGAQTLDAYRGKVLVIVNTASKCGFTPQYEGLEALWRQYGDAGLVVLGFPCNQFGGQEPGTAEQIASFCSTKYDVTFPVMAKIDVNGGQADPLFQWLKREKTGFLGTSGIKWNFTKFLVGRDGRVIGRYPPSTKPQAMADAVAAALAQAA